MSYNGSTTPLAINAKGELLSNSGFTISPVSIQYQGNWLPNQYVAGSVTDNTVLKSLTDSLPAFYQQTVATTFSVNVYRNLIRIGSGVCEALGNSRPNTFQPSYAGYGTWKKGSVDAYGNFVPNSSSPLVLVDKIYPPESYPVSSANSYIYATYNKLGWISSWPDRANWQQSTDNYRAVLEPTTGDSVGDYDKYFSNGFIGTVAQQAYYEFWYNYETRRVNQYNEFVKTFQQYIQYMQQVNIDISTFTNSKTFMKGNYSNINDLTTSDVSGVSLAFKTFGNDCIKLGKAVDLSQIHRFGIPSVLLLTLQNNNALTDALKLALLYSDLTTGELEQILEPNYIPTSEQEKKIYKAFTLISGNDLESIKITINCSTVGLQTLADLIDPKKMFPNSYPSLTIPRYSINTASSKIYDFIYVNSGVNSRIQNWGDYLEGILPNDLVIACGAFMMTMNQIKNIRQMDFEKVSQVIANLEVTNKDLPLINDANSSPINLKLANDTTAMIALGSGNSGSYRLCDFLGSMSGYPYRDYYENAISLLNQISTPALQNVYEKIKQKSLFNNWALISEGKGWPNPTINPSPTWGPEYAYNIFVTNADANAGSTSITIDLDLSGILTATKQIAFTSDGTVAYTVSSSSFDGQMTTVTFSPALATAISANTRVYIAESTYNTEVQDLIDAANLEILRINGENSTGVSRLNYYWNQIGKQLFIEQRSIPYAIPNNEDIYLDRSKSDFDTFIQSIQQYAEDTQYCGASPILESICDITTLGGQSIIAMMRETRNAHRLANTFGEVDDAIPNELNPQAASAVISSVDSTGAITAITVTYGGYGYDAANPPQVYIGPFGGVFGGSGYGATAEAVIDSGVVIAINITNSGTEYTNPNTVGPIPIEIDPPPQPVRLGDATEPGSFAGSPYTGQDPVPDNLVSKDSASYTVQQAIDLVTQCNCDCWDM
jgi:hypothetical protein